MADIVAKLDKAMADQPLVVKGSLGQDREHPLLSEGRQQRALLGRLLNQMRLPDLDADTAPATDRSSMGRALARQRWAR